MAAEALRGRGGNMLRNFHRKLIGAAAAGVMAATALVFGGAQPAAADQIGSCPYPRVCLYNSTTYTGSYYTYFQVVTDWYQVPPSRTQPITVVNTRNDDIVWVRYVAFGNQFTACLPPGARWYGNPAGGNLTVTGIMIRTPATC
ncbi:hypothetical protein ACIQVA_39530 [Streptomyces microflavus]|uniref:hypothetical protein n=1 Tax=Streptomyces microflavus TaxID=1919 RepID=UPI003823D714